VAVEQVATIAESQPVAVEQVAVEQVRQRQAVRPVRQTEAAEAEAAVIPEAQTNLAVLAALELFI
jgi:hypothetical protein